MDNPEGEMRRVIKMVITFQTNTPVSCIHYPPADALCHPLTCGNVCMSNVMSVRLRRMALEMQSLSPPYRLSQQQNGLDNTMSL